MHRLSLPFERTTYLAFKTSGKFVPKYFQPHGHTWQSSTTESLISLVPEIQTRFWTSYEIFRWYISIYTNKIKLHRPRHCKKKREQIFSYTYGGLVSRTSRELRAITMAFSLPAFQQPIRSRVWSAKIWPTRPEFLRDFWSGPILASDDIREHMGEAKNGPDRRLN